MKLIKRYYINSQEVDVSTYSERLAREIPGEYRIRTSEDRFEEDVHDALNHLDRKINEQSCELNYRFDELRSKIEEKNWKVQQRLEKLVSILSDKLNDDELRCSI